VQASQRITFIGTAPPNGPTDVEGQPFPRAHQGHQGFVIDTGGFSPTASLSLVLDAALPVLDPHIVLLMAGTNDVNGNNDLAQAPARLVRLLDKIDASEPEALVVVAQLTPTRDAVLNARIETFNAAIAAELAVLAAAGRHVALVDMYTPFVETPDYQNALLADRLHPNDAGYAIMAGVWYEAIRALLPSAAATSQ
jgi:lysophospholipase L1-like esterase